MSKRRPAIVGTSDERRALVVRQPEQHGILGVGRPSSGKYMRVDDALQQAAREDADEEVRCLEPSVHPRDATRLHGDELEAPAVLRARAAEAREAVLERDLGTVVRRVRVAPPGVRLPDLDHAVLDRLAGAVEEPPGDVDRPRIRLVDESTRDRATEEPDPQVRADGLRRSQPDLSHRAPVRVGLPRGPRARCRSGTRAPSPAASAPARTSRSSASVPARRGSS